MRIITILILLGLGQSAAVSARGIVPSALSRKPFIRDLPRSDLNRQQAEQLEKITNGNPRIVDEMFIDPTASDDWQHDVSDCENTAFVLCRLTDRSFVITVASMDTIEPRVIVEQGRTSITLRANNSGTVEHYVRFVSKEISLPDDDFERLIVASLANRAEENADVSHAQDKMEDLIDIMFAEIEGLLAHHDHTLADVNFVVMRGDSNHLLQIKAVVAAHFGNGKVKLGGEDELEPVNEYVVETINEYIDTAMRM